MMPHPETMERADIRAELDGIYNGLDHSFDQCGGNERLTLEQKLLRRAMTLQDELKRRERMDAKAKEAVG